MVDNQAFWLALHLVKGIGTSRLRGLFHYFDGDMAAAWQAPESQLEKAGLDAEAIQNLKQRRSNLNVKGTYERLHELGIYIITLDQALFPKLLQEIPDPPVLLYCRGTLLPEDSRALAIVGTRRATTYGRDSAYNLAAALAEQQITIVSGLANGIDSAAHLGALDAGGRCIGVLGNGIDFIYPRESQKIADRILSGQGAIISEYPPKTPPTSNHFPVRNRLISGLALGTLVVEASEKSGALGTALLAAEQGREVFAVPGNIDLPNSRGTNRLIQDGAKLVMHSEDILEELELSHHLTETRHVAKTIAPPDDEDAQLLALIRLEALHIDEIAIRAALPIYIVSAKMTMLALKGLVKETAPLTYMATL